jgi:hypothetical protein
MHGDDREIVGASSSSELFQLAVAYNDALDRCTQTGGENIEEVMGFIADDAVRIVTGLGDGSGVTTEVGKAAIRESFLRRSARLQQQVRLTGIELNGDFVICRRERRDSQYGTGQPDHNLRVLLVKAGKIKQVVVLVDPEERARLLG